MNVIDGEAGAINRADLAAFCLDTVLDPDFAYIRLGLGLGLELG